MCAEQLVQCSLVRILGLIARKRYQLHDKSETYSAPPADDSVHRPELHGYQPEGGGGSTSAIMQTTSPPLSAGETGQTFSDLVRNARMHNACFLLLNTDQSIDKIAECSGFGYAAISTAHLKRTSASRPPPSASTRPFCAHAKRAALTPVHHAADSKEQDGSV